jgi:glutathione peroxidase
VGQTKVQTPQLKHAAAVFSQNAVFSKIATKSGDAQSPAYAYLTSATGKTPNWNFCKYLVGKDGKVIEFYESAVTPDNADLRKAIEAALK